LKKFFVVIKQMREKNKSDKAETPVKGFEIGASFDSGGGCFEQNACRDAVIPAAPSRFLRQSQGSPCFEKFYGSFTEDCHKNLQNGFIIVFMICKCSHKKQEDNNEKNTDHLSLGVIYNVGARRLRGAIPRLPKRRGAYAFERRGIALG
jgi:hypothetical protein